MYEWLTNYGVEHHKTKFEELDVNDRTVLQDQINRARKNWSDLIELLDDVQGKYSEVSMEITKLVKELTEESLRGNTRLNQLLSLDDRYIALEARQKALRAGIDIIKEQIEFSKTDLRILNSVFYNKF